MDRSVLVSGGGGYIAGFLIRRLIADGWIVHATIRDMGRAAGLRTTLAVAAARLRFFPADLTGDAGWEAAMRECHHVAHVASPLPGGATGDDALVVPAREGTLRVLRAARAAGVRRFVMMSSIAAIGHGHAAAKRHFTETDWTATDGADVTPYIKSKTVAERAARDWIAAEGAGMEFCTVNPSLVIGPVMRGPVAGSMSIVKALLEGTYQGHPGVGFGVVDVRDVADMHALLLTAPGMAGERFIASGPFRTIGDIAQILHSRIGITALRSSPVPPPSAAASSDPAARQAAAEIGRVREMDASHAAAVLGWHPRPIEETVVDAARSLIAQNLASIR